MKKISFLLPSYNHGKFIFSTLESIRLDIEQLNPSEAELVVVDDGSSDDSVAIISRWTEKYQASFNIICIYQKNEGISAVLNKLVSLSSGQFLRLCASDDTLVPGSTRSLLDQFQSRASLICAIGDANVIDDNDKVISESSVEYHRGRISNLCNPNKIVQELIQRWCIAGPCFLIKKSHYQNLQYVNKSKIDDYHLFLSLTEISNSLVFSNHIVCKYRVHATNTSKTIDVSRRIENLKDFLKIVEFYLARKILGKYLMPVKYKTIAKIYYLRKKYIYSAANLCVSFLLKFK